MGATLYAASQVAAQTELLLKGPLGNPHSNAQTSEAVERTRALVLRCECACFCT
jgi:hypothetical protein